LHDHLLINELSRRGGGVDLVSLQVGRWLDTNAEGPARCASGAQGEVKRSPTPRGDG